MFKFRWKRTCKSLFKDNVNSSCPCQAKVFEFFPWCYFSHTYLYLLMILRCQNLVAASDSVAQRHICRQLFMTITLEFPETSTFPHLSTENSPFSFPCSWFLSVILEVLSPRQFDDIIFCLACLLRVHPVSVTFPIMLQNGLQEAT